jgi:hypothetical protein
MTESAGLETILTPGGSMRCGIVKMHYPSSRVRISPAVQDISEQLKHVLAEVGAGKLCLRWEPIDQDGAADAQEQGEHRFPDADRGSHSCGTSSADKHSILSCSECCRNQDSSPVTRSRKLTPRWLSRSLSNCRESSTLFCRSSSVNMCGTQRRK